MDGWTALSRDRMRNELLAKMYHARWFLLGFVQSDIGICVLKHHQCATDSTWAILGEQVVPCSKQFVHDWKECSFAHEGETARRRHP